MIFSKTNTPELGLAPSTKPRRFGPTRNPWNLAHSAGGSIRIPASCCALFGLKPTRARNPLGPDAGEGWGGASAGHAVTRTVRDSTALLDATSGPDVGDPYWAPPPAGLFLAEVGRDPGRLRVALTTTPWNGQAVDAECVEAARSAARLCEALGRALTEADVEKVTLARASDGISMTAADYARSIGVVHRAGRAVARFFLTYDVLLSPTMCRPPFPLGVMDMMSADDSAYLGAVLASIAFTSLFNSAGNPAMSVPLAWSQSGLPIGVQFAGRFGDEATLFRLAAQLEAARPWADRRPSLSVASAV